MAQQRPQAATGASGPHSVSLKVLRLSRPTLAAHSPLPSTRVGNGLDIIPKASLAYPSADPTSTFPLTPLLTLPPAFGSAYVGETFACTLCANNDLEADDPRSVSAVRVVAELQTPSNQAGILLELASAESSEGEQADELGSGATCQYSLQHDLKEEGSHVLAVTVTYTETVRDDAGGAASGRARTFRKLYQFVAQQLVAVRSKVSDMKRREKDVGRRWVLEAQLENLGESPVVLERVWLAESEGLKSTGVNADEAEGALVLKPLNVEQVAFVLEGLQKSDEVALGKRMPLAQLHIEWRNVMGARGSLTTGWLASRGR